ncbi:pyrroloquinoline-quinone glucose dehydrogenase [Longimonas halophila]|uniref:Pyrroloquinoline-quinone glucose dehydrogenase n=1 Tax=Longimonas halophila TaxID=1469170 RepID=A0A2H3NMW6_9BACT|nr:pyrroloquinoline-quinone glucose dehydrogenase [Longimonas halophila]
MRTIGFHSVLVILGAALLAGCGGNASSDVSAADNSADSDTSASQGEIVVDLVESEELDFQVVQLADNLENPWGIAFLPDGDMLVTERPGRLNRVSPDGSVTPLSGLPEIRSVNQGGLLDVVLHPDYENTGWIYFTYSNPQGEEVTTTTIARAQLEGDALTNMETLYVQDPPKEPGRHYGSRIVFLEDGTFLASIGDRGLRDPAQDTQDDAGVLLRLNADGSVPSDNPFVDDDSVNDAHFSYGHRNPQGIIRHPETGTIWAHEHGPRGGDELNLIEAGNNYGWPEATYGREYDADEPVGVDPDQTDRFVEPVIQWTPSIAPSGLAVYDGDAFPEWQGNLFVGALAYQQVRRVVLDGNEVTHQETLLANELGRIRDVRTGPDGFIYLLTDDASGGIFRLEPVE